MSTVLFLLGVLCLLVAIHPFVTYPWSLLVLSALRPARRLTPTIPEDRIDCAICVCAYNEEHIIARKVENLMALRAREPGLEILIYVDGASDRTAEILRDYASQVSLHIGTRRLGKTYGMNLLASKARASVLIFTDANVLLDLDCVRDLRRYFSDAQIGCVCGTLIYTNSGSSATASSGSAYWRFEESIKRLESDSGSMIGADGSVFALRRSLHQPPPEDIIDDFYVSLKVLCSGHRVIQANDAVAYEESVVSGPEEFSRKIRIACQAFNVHRLLWPELRGLDGLTLYKYVSHKLVRWFTVYLLSIAGLAFEAALVLAGHAALGATLLVGLVVALLVGHLTPIWPFAQFTSAIAALAGTGLGIWRSLRGARYRTWKPAASIRRLPG